MITRELELTGSASVADILRRVFARLAPGRSLPMASRYVHEGLSNYGGEEAFYTAEGDGLLVGEVHGGALPNEDPVDIVYRLTIGTDISMHVSVVRGVPSKTLVFRLNAPAEAVDAAADALIDCAKMAGLRLRT